MDLIILESPNKIRDVERYAHAMGLDVRAIATVGHLLDLPPMASGPAIDTVTFVLNQLQPRDGAAAARVEKIKAAIRQADRVIVATDPDREGEAIGAEVWEWIRRGHAYRATFEEITPAGVERGIREMRPTLAETAVEAAHTRRVIDRLAGWHGTALVFDKLRQHRGLSAGRLQSAALRLVVERHRDHEGFRPTTAFGLRAKLATTAGVEFWATLVDEHGKPRTFPNEIDAGAVPQPTDGHVRSVDAERKQHRPRPPFEASSWLQVAARTLRLSVKDATRATQELFEAGSTTYPRTDTVRVADEAVTWAREEIERRFGRAYVPDKPWVHKDRGAAVVQGAHEAIRPTTPHGEPLEGRRRGQWGEAYALIEARFLASQAAARVVEKTTIKIEAGPLSFVAHGEVELFDGWRRVLAGPTEEDTEPASSSGGQDDERDEGEHLPVLAKGDLLNVTALEVTTHTTRPRPLYDQASLVAELKRLGIGRPSTYQTVVPLLLSRAWVTEQRQIEDKARGSKAAPLPFLVPSAAGTDLSDFLLQALPGLVDYEFTASMERALDEVESGERRRVDVARDWWARFERELSAAKAIVPRLPERKDLGPCPSCAKAGRAGRLRLIQGVSPETKKPYEFAGCDADSKEVRTCGHKAQVKDGRLLPSPPCSQCAAPLRAVNRKDGGHSWRCEEHGWFLAGRKWELVKAPECPECSAPMVHRERRDPKGEFFWACFSHKVFLSSDKFGGVEKRRRSA